MKNNRKTILILACLATICLLVFGLTACNNSSSHKHNYTAINYNEYAHWFECDCGEKSPFEFHKGGTITCSQQAECDICTAKYGKLLSEHNYINLECVNCGETSTECFSFALLSDDTYEITALIADNFPSNIKIPATYNEKAVTSIGEGAFLNDEEDFGGLTSVIIPNSVISIGNSAFSGCSGLTSVVIPNSVTSIGNYTFRGCISLTSVVIPNSVTSISTGAFSGCSSLTSVVIGDSVTSIGKDAFRNCSGLTSVVIPNSVTSIGFYAFYGCSNLTSIVIPNSVTSIGWYAFSGCSGLVSVEIPNSVISIGYYAFEYCSGLKEVNYLGTIDEWAQIGFSGYYVNPLYYAKQLKINGEVITEVNLTTATKISDSAFRGCQTITSVVIGDSVTSIGSRAFEGCSSLTSVVIGDSVTSIGFGAFAYCSSLTSVVIGDGVGVIGSEAFADCYKLVEVINNSPYITVEKGDSSNGAIGYYALSVSNCDDNYQSKLLNDNGYIIYVDNSEKILVGYTGSEANLVLPNYITKINQYAFVRSHENDMKTLENTNLVSIVIPNSVTEIGYGAFAFCTMLTSIEIPNSVTEIGEGAFGCCTSLTSVVIPDSVTKIGEGAFVCCYKLVEVINNSPYITVSKGDSSNGCIGYYALSVSNCDDSYVSKLSNDNGFIIYTGNSEKILVGYIGNETNLVLPNYINKINQYAFVRLYDNEIAIENTNLFSIEIPNSVTEIGSYAFSGCTNLKNIYYTGTQEEWDKITKNSSWDYATGDYTITYNYKG